MLVVIFFIWRGRVLCTYVRGEWVFYLGFIFLNLGDDFVSELRLIFMKTQIISMIDFLNRAKISVSQKICTFLVSQRWKGRGGHEPDNPLMSNDEYV